MNLFCYGTLMWPDIWQHTVQSEYSVKDAYIKGFKRLQVKKQNYPALIHSHGEQSEKDFVHGKVYFDVNAHDFIRAQEHIGKEFEVLDGACFTADSEIAVSAKIFLWRTEHRSLLSSEEWTREWFEEKALNLYRREMNQSLF